MENTSVNAMRAEIERLMAALAVAEADRNQLAEEAAARASASAVPVFTFDGRAMTQDEFNRATVEKLKQLDALTANAKSATGDAAAMGTAKGAGSSGLQKNKPTKFTGKREATAVDSFLYSVRNYFRGVNLPEMEKISLTVGFLDEKALTWWEVSETEEAASTLEDMLERIKKEFRPANASQAAVTKLDRLKQGRTFKRYLDDFRDLVVKIDDMDEAAKLRAFKKGLKKPYHLHVLTAQAKTLKDAIQAANDYAEAEAEADGFTAETPKIAQPGMPRSAAEPDDTGAAPMDIDKLFIQNKKKDTPATKKGDDDAKEKAKKEKRRLMAEGRCFNCGMQGHLAADCKEPKKTTGFQSRQ